MADHTDTAAPADAELPLFELDPEPTFRFSAVIEAAGGRRGRLHLVGRHMPRTDFVDYSAAGQGKPDVDFIGGLLAGWDERHGPYSPERLARLLADHPRAARAIYTAYGDELLGVERGN